MKIIGEMLPKYCNIIDLVKINNLNNKQLLDLEKNVRNEFFSREAQVKENIQLNNDHLFDNMNFGENNNILNCFIIIFFN